MGILSYNMICLIIILSPYPQYPFQFRVFIQARALVWVWFVWNCLRLHPNDCPHTALKSIPIWPKPDWIFYRPNQLIIHIIGLLMKSENLHLNMNVFFLFQYYTRINKCVQVWEEMEHYCLGYGVPKLTKIAILRHLVSYSINFQSQHSLSGL